MQAWHYLQARKKQFVGLIILTILTSLQMVSLGAIFPFITILTQPEKISPFHSLVSFWLIMGLMKLISL